ncbi:MAG: hypothetical protein IKP95_02635 [Ruminococcus sp.]|nr:hypothetical protein [Ruminococcus sp.]
MRKLDELLQDIPLDELMGGSSERSEETGESGFQPDASRPEAKPEPVRIKSSLPAYIAAAVIAAVIGAGALIFSLRHSGIEPGSPVSDNEADPIYSYDTDGVAFQNVGDSYRASLLFNSMAGYAASYREQRGREFSAGEIFIDLGNVPDYLSEAVIGMERLAKTSLREGYALFVFREDSSLAFAEWTKKEDAPVYCFTDTSKTCFTVKSLGDFPTGYEELAKREKNRTDGSVPYGLIRVTKHFKNGASGTFITRSELPYLFTWLKQIRNYDRSPAADIPADNNTVTLEFMELGEKMSVVIMHDGTNAVYLNGEAVNYESMNNWLISYCTTLIDRLDL